MVELSFVAKNGQGNNRGAYDSMVDIGLSGTHVTLIAPTGWTIVGINVYLNGTGEPPNAAKQADMQTLRQGNASTATYTDVFATRSPVMPGSTRSTGPEGFSYGGLTFDDATILVDNATGGAYEFLVWIQQPDENDDQTMINDYCDPGFKNTY